MEMPVADFRLGDDAKKNNIDNANLYDLVNSYKYKIDWYEDYLKDIGTNYNSSHYLDKFDVTTHFEEIASDIRKQLKLDAVTKEKKRGVPKTFFKEFKEKCEDFGIWIVSNSFPGTNTRNTIPPEVCNGFTLKSMYSPMIWINAKSYTSVKVFTLAHELAHLWIGQEGLSNLNPRNENLDNQKASNNIEKLCDMVASELLVPRNDLTNLWIKTGLLSDDLDKLNTYFGVSRFVILNKMRSLSLISDKDYFDTRKKLITKIVTSVSGQPSGGNYYANQTSRKGKNFARAVINSMHEQRISIREAGDLLDTPKYKTIIKLDEWLQENKETIPSNEIPN